jgi:hypothetical protein
MIFMENLEEIISRISSQTGADKNEILLRVKEKQRELSNLISEEGAAYIVAKESGIELIKKKEYELKIGSIMGGMRSVSLTARVLKIEETRAFKTDRAEGKVCSIRLGDETGIIRLTLWNDQIGKAEELKRDSLVKITNAFAKDNFGKAELSLGKLGKLEKVQDSAAIIYADEIEQKFVSEQGSASSQKHYDEIGISGLREGSNARIRACIAQVFESSPFFLTCPECSMRVEEACKLHGKSEPNLVISGIVDDGTGNIRAVFFRSAAESLLGMSTAEAWQIYEPRRNAESIISRIPLAKDFILKGFVKRNKLYERLEFVVNEVEEVNVKREIEKMMK